MKANNEGGTVTFAMAGSGTGTTQISINRIDHVRLDAENFSMLCEVISGMDIVDRILEGCGETTDNSTTRKLILEKNFPKLSYQKEKVNLINNSNFFYKASIRSQ